MNWRCGVHLIFNDMSADSMLTTLLKLAKLCQAEYDAAKHSSCFMLICVSQLLIMQNTCEVEGNYAKLTPSQAHRAAFIPLSPLSPIPSHRGAVGSGCISNLIRQRAWHQGQCFGSKTLCGIQREIAHCGSAATLSITDNPPCDGSFVSDLTFLLPFLSHLHTFTALQYWKSTFLRDTFVHIHPPSWFPATPSSWPSPQPPSLNPPFKNSSSPVPPTMMPGSVASSASPTTKRPMPLPAPPALSPVRPASR